MQALQYKDAFINSIRIPILEIIRMHYTLKWLIEAPVRSIYKYSKHNYTCIDLGVMDSLPLLSNVYPRKTRFNVIGNGSLNLKCWSWRHRPFVTSPKSCLMLSVGSHCYMSDTLGLLHRRVYEARWYTLMRQHIYSETTCPRNVSTVRAWLCFVVLWSTRTGHDRILERLISPISLPTFGIFSGGVTLLPTQTEWY